MPVVAINSKLNSVGELCHKKRNGGKVSPTQPPEGLGKRREQP